MTSFHPGSLPNGTVGRSDEHTPYEPVEQYRADIDAAERAKDAAGEADPLADLVEKFSRRLLAKLRLARANGRSGWERDDWEADCQRGLLRHIEKGDPRDVAAYCAFMDHHGWITKPAAPSDGAREALEALSLWVTTERQKYRVAGGMPAGGFDNMTPIEIALAKVEGEIDRRAALRAPVDARVSREVAHDPVLVELAVWLESREMDFQGSIAAPDPVLQKHFAWMTRAGKALRAALTPSSSGGGPVQRATESPSAPIGHRKS